MELKSKDYRIMSTYFINEVYDLPQEFIDDMHTEMNNQYAKLQELIGETQIHPLSLILQNLSSELVTNFLITIDDTPVSIITGIKHDDLFEILTILSIRYNGSRDYLYQPEYFTCLNNGLIERGYTGKRMATYKELVDDNWIRRSCTEYPLADSYTPTIRETEKTTVWTWSFS